MCCILQGLEAPGGPSSNEAKLPGESASGTLAFEVWRFSRLEVPNVLRILALGGSMCGILQGLEAPGGSTSNKAKVPGGSA